MRLGLGWLVVAGCWNVQDEVRKRQVWEMQDHEQALVAGREALGRGDLGGLRQAGADLALPDPLPGLAPEAVAHLEQLRAAGRRLSEVGDLTQGAEQLAGLTESCAACHRQMGVAAPAPLSREPADAQWLALAFESDAAWVARPGAPPATTWAERRAAVAAASVR